MPSNNRDTLTEMLKGTNKEGEWQAITDGYEQLWNFNNCIGAIDDKHMICPTPNSGSEYFNYKQVFSVVMAMRDTEYKLMLDVMVEYFMVVHSKTVAFTRHFITTLYIPEQTKLPGSRENVT
uniref:DDE Tnp4 domain-containing protein n=1 Tax=Amphimedon queenslandica TaxID=400682 RepID=A0A1X7ULQ8_AMPQE